MPYRCRHPIKTHAECAKQLKLLPGFLPIASAMSSTPVVQNGGSSVLLLICVAALTFLFYNYMTRNHFLQANSGALVRLALELIVLALAGFVAGVGVLFIYHFRIDQQGQQLSEQGAVAGRKTASPLDFIFGPTV